MAELGYRNVIVASTAEVREAVAQYMIKNGRAESWTVTWRTPELLGLDTGGSYPGDKYRQQVLRALNWLASQGVLVKVDRGRQRPSGHWASQYPWFYTRTAYLAERRDRDGERAAAKIETDRWATLYDRLARRGIEPHTERGQEISLELDQWHRLLNGRSDLP